jgi:hypothetical protein
MAFVTSLALVSASAFASGSIVISGPSPKRLAYQEGAVSVELEMTFTDIQISAAVKKWLDSRYGMQRGEYPYMIDKQSKTVSVLVERASGRYEVIPFSELK